MSEEKKDLTDEVTNKTNELSDEELDKVSGGACDSFKILWKDDLAKSTNPNGFGSTFSEWEQLRPIRKENSEYGEIRCIRCGSWKTRWEGGCAMSMWVCQECGAANEGWNSAPYYCIQKYGAKGVSIYYHNS